MIIESDNHKTLKKVLKQYYEQLGFFVKEEDKIGTKIVDLAIYHKYRVIRIVECIHGKSIKDTKEKLLSMEIDCEKEIARMYKKTSPYGKRIIEDLKEKNIIFTQILPTN